MFFIDIIALAAAFGTGVYFSQKIRDYLNNFPAEARAQIVKAEAEIKAKL